MVNLLLIQSTQVLGSSNFKKGRIFTLINFSSPSPIWSKCLCHKVKDVLLNIRPYNNKSFDNEDKVRLCDFNLKFSFLPPRVKLKQSCSNKETQTRLILKEGAWTIFFKTSSKLEC